MTHATARIDRPHSSDPHTAALQRLEQAIEHAKELLPAQGPITVFVHHNTLHAFEHLPFDEGVQLGSRIYGCQPYLSEDRYREEFARGRIGKQDLEDVLHEDLGDDAHTQIGSLGSRFQLRLAMLEYPLRTGLAEELRWFVAETDALTTFRKDAPPEMRRSFIAETERWVMRNLREQSGSMAAGSSRSTDRRGLQLLADLIEKRGRHAVESWSEATWESLSLEALWRVCRHGVQGVEVMRTVIYPPRRHRSLLQEVTGADSDQLVGEVLIRYCAAFLDQGVAPWPLPGRDQGFLAAFRQIYGTGRTPDVWLRPLAKELSAFEDPAYTPLESIADSLDKLGVTNEERADYIAATFLALRGWAGMIHQTEARADRVNIPAPHGSLMEFLTVRLILDRLALTFLAKEELDYSGPLSHLREQLQSKMSRHDSAHQDQRAFLVFQLAQVRGWHPSLLLQFGKQEWATLIHELEDFGSLERRRVFHRAFEYRFRRQTLDALSLHVPPSPAPESPEARSRRVLSATSSNGSAKHRVPRFQVVTCIDEREESFKRHLEEIEPDAETYAAAGFFCIPMYYRGAADARFVPLCPIVILPQNWVVEDVVAEQEKLRRQRAKARKALGTASHRMHVGSRGLASGALLTAGLGVLASVPLVARVLFPRLTSLVRHRVSHFVRPPAATQLRLERDAPTPGSENGQVGFSLEEMTNMAERLLRDMGLTSGFAPLVAIIGHGSNSLNNPHKSAYDCGACGGGAGGPNARAMAQIYNDPRVRGKLAERGLLIPSETWFVGGFHNTCNDRVTFFDREWIPQSHAGEFAMFERLIEQTCDRNAHERCRRFQSAPLSLSFSAARRHVEARAEDLAQTRPECGHATNAICIVGRRERTRGLYLDRRAFLTSYDPTKDDSDSTILARILAAVVPVCAGISLEYYFSYVDSPGWGCGTKLPHNITSLLGVMDGAASDLRTGLPWQMVEIHEPLRLIFVVESTPEKMLRIMNANESIRRLCYHEWVQMATLDPHSNQMHYFTPNGFVPYRPATQPLPRASSSFDWYRGWRDHLAFAEFDRNGPNGN